MSINHLLELIQRKPEKYKVINSNACVNVMRSPIRCQSFPGVNLEIQCRPLVKSV